MGLTLYAQTFSLYFCQLFNMDPKWEKLVAAVMITFFYFVNFFGVDAMAKVQNLMTVVLLGSLVWFVIRGLPKVNWSTFFDDGWLPRSLGDLHPKYKTAYQYLIIYYFITMAPLVLGVDISSVSDMTLLGSYTQQALFIFFMRKIPDMFPEAWERSMFHMPRTMFDIIMWICFAGSVMNVWGQITNSSMTTLAVNVTVMVIGVVFSLTWYKSGKVTPTQSYEIETGV